MLKTSERGHGETKSTGFEDDMDELVDRVLLTIKSNNLMVARQKHAESMREARRNKQTVCKVDAPPIPSKRHVLREKKPSDSGQAHKVSRKETVSRRNKISDYPVQKSKSAKKSYSRQKETPDRSTKNRRKRKGTFAIMFKGLLFPLCSFYQATMGQYKIGKAVAAIFCDKVFFAPKANESIKSLQNVAQDKAEIQNVQEETGRSEIVREKRSKTFPVVFKSLLLPFSAFYNGMKKTHKIDNTVIVLSRCTTFSLLKTRKAMYVFATIGYVLLLANVGIQGQFHINPGSMVGAVHHLVLPLGFIILAFMVLELGLRLERLQACQEGSNLKGEMSALSAIKQAFVSARKDQDSALQELEKGLEELQTSKTQFSTELEGLKLMGSLLVREKHAQEAEAAKIKEAWGRMTASKDDLTGSFKEVKSLKESMEQNLLAHKTEAASLEDTVKSFAKSAQFIKNELEDAEAQRKSCKAAKNDLETEMLQAQKQLKRVRKVNVSLTSAIDEAESVQNSFMLSGRTQNELMDSLDEGINLVTEKTHHLNADVKNIQDFGLRLDETKKMMGKFANVVKSYEDAIAEKRSEVEALREVRKRLEVGLAKIRTMQVDSTTPVNRPAHHAKLNHKIDETNNKYSVAKQKLKYVQSKLAAERARGKRMGEKLEEKTLELEALKDLFAMSTFHEVEDEVANKIEAEHTIKSDPAFSKAMQEQCNYLGINLNTQPEYAWIAEESMLAALPEGWKEEKNENGVPFYHNLETEESQWEHPSDEYYRDLLHRLLREDAEVDHSEDDSNSIGGRGMVVAVHDLEERSDGEDILL